MEFSILTIHQYHYPTREREWVLTVLFGSFVLVIVLGVGLMIFWLMGWLVRKVLWLVRRERCQHEECGNQWTTHRSSSSDAGCKLGRCVCGQPCCDDCYYQHDHDFAQQRADREPLVDCVHGHSSLQKVVVEVLDDEFIIIDRCKNGCGGYWLDGGELAKLKELAEQKGYNSGYSAGQSSGTSTGLAIGIALP